MSEDEFELVMAAFEKVTPEKTEYLHHALNLLSVLSPISIHFDSNHLPA